MFMRLGGTAMQSSIEKRSISLGSHKTSISLEDPFWKALRDIARQRRMTLGQLVETINANRKVGNLSSAIRLFVLRELQDQIETPRPEPKGSDFKLVG
jgi:predicted DNA-binding ribbon-helix-helix protein